MDIGTWISTAKLKSALMTALLLGVAALGPSVAYAGVSVIWPSSTQTADVDETPPITFSAGTDHATAQSLGFAGAFSAENNGASYTLSLNGLSGGEVTIDDVANVSVDPAVSSHKVEVATALGSGIAPDTLKLRLWTGTTAPTADGDAQVCAVLDLTAAQGAESTGSCDKSTKVQVVYALPSGQTTESDTVTIRPSSITFA